MSPPSSFRLIISLSLLCPIFVAHLLLIRTTSSTSAATGSLIESSATCLLVFLELLLSTSPGTASSTTAASSSARHPQLRYVSMRAHTSSGIDRSTSLSSHSLSSISHNCTDRLLTESRWLLRPLLFEFCFCCCGRLCCWLDAAGEVRVCNKLCRSSASTYKKSAHKMTASVILPLSIIYRLVNVCNLPRKLNQIVAQCIFLSPQSPLLAGFAMTSNHHYPWRFRESWGHIE